MAKNGKEGYEHYKSIISSAMHERCPYCGISNVDTLDHYLPKTKYPALVVTPFNLIPSCSACNKSKGSIVGNQRSDEPLHPYYDNIDDEIWLKCDIIHEEEFAIKYRVIRPDAWSGELFIRAEKYFRDLKLNIKFTSNANYEYSCRIRSHKRHYLKDTKEGFFEFMQESLEDYETSYTNSWVSAFYRELCENNWYYDVWLKRMCATN